MHFSGRSPLTIYPHFSAMSHKKETTPRGCLSREQTIHAFPSRFAISSAATAQSGTGYSGRSAPGSSRRAPTRSNSHTPSELAPPSSRCRSADGEDLATAEVDLVTPPAHNTAVEYFPSVPPFLNTQRKGMARPAAPGKSPPSLLSVK
jgi:hypothetical protein